MKAPWLESWINLLFDNGHYQETFPGNLPTNEQISNMASNDLAANLTSNVGGIMDYSDDGFAALNTAFMSDGPIITVPEGENAGIVINLIFSIKGCPTQ